MWSTLEYISTFRGVNFGDTLGIRTQFPASVHDAVPFPTHMLIGSQETSSSISIE